MEISFTRLRVYLECPWKYKLQFLDGRRIPLTPASSLGLSLHRALEAFHRKDAGSLEDLLDCYDDRWLGSGYPDDETKERWYQKGQRILEGYHEREPDRRTEIVGVEREFVYPLGDHTVRGMIDRLDRHPDGRHEVIDYKTHLDFETEAQLADDLQLRFYGLGVREALGVTPALLSVDYVAVGRRVSVPYDASKEAALKALIVKTADAIDAGAFEADTAYCPKCAYRETCPFSAAKDL